jgi:hypothetical protein
MASCSLEEKPYGFYSEDNFYRTEDDARAAVNYAYATLTYIEYSRSIFFVGDMPSENMTTKSDASVDNRALNTWSIANFNTNETLMNFFKYSYICINRANALIKKIPDTDIDPALRDQYLGEAHFLRAYNYFCLSRNFGLVPMHYDLVETLSQTAAPLAADMDQIYDFMIEDCQQAEALLPVYPTPVMGRVDRVAAQALLAKLYLYAASAKEHGVPLYRDMGKSVDEMYAQAAKYAGRVLNLDPQYPQSTYWFENDLLAIYDVFKSTGRENIFLMSMDRTGESEGQYSKISKMFIPYIDGATIWLKQGNSDTYIKSHDGYAEYRTEIGFYNQYESGDLRKAYLIADKIYTQQGGVRAEWKADGSGSIPYPFCRKYIDPEFDGDKTSTRPILLRFSDIALVYAEAAGPTPEAYAAVNYIRRRAGLGEATPNLSLPDFREMVYNERKFEMAFEGDRMYDIRRWNKTAEIQQVHDASLTEAQYTFYPLPLTEITLNPSLN